MTRCQKTQQIEGKFYDAFKKIYHIKSTEETNDRPLPNEVLTAWQQTCCNLAPVAYVSYCAENPDINPDLSEEIQKEYDIIFGKTPDVKKNIQEWKNVYKLIKQDIDQSQDVSTTSEKDVFFSERHYEKKRYCIRFNFLKLL